MEINKLLEEVTDPKEKEVLMLFFSGWMDRISQKQKKENPEKYKLANERFQNWERLIKKSYPELTERNQEFLDWLVSYYEEDLENYYLCGFCDGIRIIKWIFKF